MQTNLLSKNKDKQFHLLLTLFFIILLASTLSVEAQTNLLQSRITIKTEEISLEEALKAIGEESGYNFSYSNDDLPAKKRVRLIYQQSRLYDILRDLLGTDVSKIKVTGKTIHLRGSDGRGDVRGTVRTRDGQAAGYVTVGIPGQRSTEADARGRFTLKEIEEGTHRIVASYVGLKAQEQRITVRAGSAVEVDFILPEDAQSLQEVIITSQHNLADKQTEYVARMPLSNLENPQIYSVVSKELMNLQIATNVSQAVRNAPGAVPTEHDSGGLTVLTRGFRSGINARNGMESSSSRTSIDIANVERIEVLKGPSGTLFGATVSSFGGVVNQVTKKPFAAKRTELSYTAGSYGLNRITADINTPLDTANKILFRVNSAYTTEKTFLSSGFHRSFLLAPSVSYQINDRLTFQLDAELLHVNRTQPWYTLNSVAAGFKSPKDLPIPFKTALVNEDADAENTATKVFAEAKYQLSDQWTSSTLFSFAGEDIDHSYQLFNAWTSPTVMIPRVTKYGPITQNFLGLQENINGQFHTGTIKHKILLGASYRYYSSTYTTSSGSLDPVDISSGYRPLSRQEIDPYLTTNSSPIADEHALGLYATDVINLTDRFSTLLSLRFDHFNRKAVIGTEGFKQHSLAPKIGLVYQVIKEQVSLFANYMSGFQNQSPVDQPDGTRQVFNPTFARQSEAGVKAELLDRKLTLTGSYYHIAINDAINYNVEGFAIQDGKQVSKGAEFEVLGNPLPGLRIVAGYVYNSNRITENIDPAIKGKYATDAPRNVFNTWLSYTFQHKLRGLGMGLGANYVGRSYLFSDNQYYIPSYKVVDATVFYDQPKWRIGIKLNNIGNERYWGLWGMPQAPRNFAANLALRF